MSFAGMKRETWGHCAGWAPVVLGLPTLAADPAVMKYAGSLLAAFAFLALLIAAGRLFPLPQRPEPESVPAKEYWSIYGGLWAAGSAVLLLVATTPL